MRNSKSARSEAGAILGRHSYRARLKRFGIERIQEIARENGKKGGRPRKDAKPKEAER